jgi:hypothetical protein
MTKKYVDPRSVKLIDLVRNNKKIRFSYFRDKEFWFEHEDGLLFPIPLNDVLDPAISVTLYSEDKAIFFMKWIKRYLEEAQRHE